LARHKVRTFPWLIAPRLALARFGLSRLSQALSPLAIQSFDAWMARQLEPCDVFHCLPGFGLKTQRVARGRYGALTVFDGASPHIRFHDAIVAEEHEIWRVPYKGIDRRIVERELQEYQECDLITPASNFVRRTCIQNGIPGEKLITIPYGVDLGMFRPVPKEDKNL
jgi:glycosyltransferase involved in cell wall biosynthesis